MVCGTIMVAVCLASMSLGQEVDIDDDIPQTNSNILMDFQHRLTVLENLHKEDTIRIGELEKQRHADQSRIAILEKQQRLDNSRISDFVNNRFVDKRNIASLLKQRRTDRQRIDDLEKQKSIDENRLYGIENRLDLGHLKDIVKECRKDLNVTSTVDVKRPTSGRKSKHDTIKSTSVKNDQEIEKRVSDNGNTVAFSAVLSHDYKPIVDHMEMHFDNVVTNIGGSYSGNTGTFTCSRAGVYVFLWTVHVNPRFAYTELVKNAVVVGKAFSGDSQYSGYGGSSVVLQLVEGDEVWVRVGAHATLTYIYGNARSTMFSGFLLQ
ncbi:uncharacterized protein LOC132561993 [Ylistrum balloti]|uniref:uncharacterized protein LOC132561993 n=1 Tax=Ylistrum balloti TaxID=509963 RepID=UPI002905F1FE|nr:uncharacterized protein LOC132561993 [Ylistrum balloti]